MNSGLTENDIEQILLAAIRELYKRDRGLIEHGVHEVAITHRLAIYIEDALRKSGDSESHVDIEYNKNMRKQKELVLGEGGKRPDIIIHKRQSNKHNQLIVELKKNKSIEEGDDDDRKLKGATEPTHTFQFTLGVYLNLKPDQCICTFYSKGRQTKEETVTPASGEGLGYDR